jgi:hypothetical protein
MEFSLIYSLERLGKNFEKQVQKLAALETEDVQLLKESSQAISFSVISQE